MHHFTSLILDTIMKNMRLHLAALLLLTAHFGLITADLAWYGDGENDGDCGFFADNDDGCLNAMFGEMFHDRAMFKRKVTLAN